MPKVTLVLLIELRRWCNVRLQGDRLRTLLLGVLVLPIVLERRAFVLSATATTAATATALAFWIRLVTIFVIKAGRWALLQIVLILCCSRRIASWTRSLLWTTLVRLSRAFSLLTIGGQLLVACVQTFVATIASTAATATATVAAVVIACLLETLWPWRLRVTFIVTGWAAVVVLARRFITTVAALTACFVPVVRTTSATTTVAASTIVLTVAAALLA